MNTPLPVDSGNLATNALYVANITSHEDLGKLSENDLTKLRSVGLKTISILKR